MADGGGVVKRVLVDHLTPVGDTLIPPADECHHLVRVRRIGVGETLELLDGRGGVALGEVIQVGKQDLTVRVTEILDPRRESPLQLTVAAALPSQLNTYDGVLPGLVQMGVTTLYLVPTAYGGRLKKEPARYLARLENIVRQSLKQCGRTVTPRLEMIKDWPTLCSRMAVENAVNVVLHPVKEKPVMPQAVNRLGLLIGPEGGLTDDEVAGAQEHGCLVRGLGPRILKMETALIAGTAWAQDHFGDW